VCGCSAKIYCAQNGRSNRIKRKDEKERRGGMYTTSVERGACTPSRRHFEGARALAYALCNTYSHTAASPSLGLACSCTYSGGGANPVSLDDSKGMKYEYPHLHSHAHAQVVHLDSYPDQVCMCACVRCIRKPRRTRKAAAQKPARKGARQTPNLDIDVAYTRCPLRAPGPACACSSAVP
jgi:hypothetical protein